MSCIAVMVPGFLLSGCKTLYVQAGLENQKLTIPVSAFNDDKSGKAPDALIALNDHLSFPILVVNSDPFRAFEMKCTHQGAELQWTGSRITCPAHGSEFDLKGGVVNGPADQPLKEFPVNIQNQQLIIQLT